MDSIYDPKGQARYEAWTIMRIIEGRDCYLDRYVRCIPSQGKDCKSCYQKYISKIEGTSGHKGFKGSD